MSYTCQGGQVYVSVRGEIHHRIGVGACHGQQHSGPFACTLHRVRVFLPRPLGIWPTLNSPEHRRVGHRVSVIEPATYVLLISGLAGARGILRCLCHLPAHTNGTKRSLSEAETHTHTHIHTPHEHKAGKPDNETQCEGTYTHVSHTLRS